MTIGNSVTTIGGLAFRYCDGFTGNLTLGSSVRAIYYGAFDGDFVSVKCLNSVPAEYVKSELFGPFFYESYCKKTPLIVPEGSENAYAKAPVWEWFKTINGIDISGIEDIESDYNGIVQIEGGDIIAPEGSEVFDLNGRRVKPTNLPNGIYIVHVPGSKAVKVMVK